MAPKKDKSPPSDPDGVFSGMAVFLIETGVQSRRLQIWKQKLVQMGAKLEDRFTKNVSHIFATDADRLLEKLDKERLIRSKAKLLAYQWLEDSLVKGEKASEDLYVLSLQSGGESLSPKADNDGHSRVALKKSRISAEDDKNSSPRHMNDDKERADSRDTKSASSLASRSSSPETTSPEAIDSHNKPVGTSDSSSLYKPPDLNRNITQIFGKLLNIYRALGDDRRSFSYYKAIPVIEKLPFKIESVDQVKHLPSIGKSMQDHIQEIVTTGKLSKLEHFEKDEKVKTISLFGEVWGIGPATALKLYEKGHRTLDDLRNEESLTHSQRLGLKYFDDIQTRIPRHEVEEMERLLQKVGEEILPGVIVVCGGSYRRGKASCGDMDIVITHPDGKSHKGFLPKFVKRLKDMNFLREDLVFSVHSIEGTDSGVDTYFGLCTYPGRELRHRIDLKMLSITHVILNVFILENKLKNNQRKVAWCENSCLITVQVLLTVDRFCYTLNVYPRDIYAFGLIAWTGNDVLNRRLRLLAESKGFLLDDTGLYPATHSSGGKRTKGSASLKFDTEKQVFEFLGFPALEPHERNL